MIVGGYHLDLYCINRDVERHGYVMEPATFVEWQTAREAYARARQLGWKLNIPTSEALCPRCNPRSKSYMPLATRLPAESED